MSESVAAPNRLIRQIQALARVQYILAGAALVAAGLFYLLSYRPQQQEIADLDRQTASKQMELSSARTQTDRLPRVTLELAALRHRLAGFKKLPDDPQYGQFIRDINQASERAQLTKLVVAPGTAQREDLFSEQPIVLTFQGDFTHVWQFIHDIEDMQRLTRLWELSINKTDSDTGAVDVRLSMNIYYAPSPVRADAKSASAGGL